MSTINLLQTNADLGPVFLATQVFDFYHDIAPSYDNHNQVHCIFFSISKVFDVVPHRFVLQKLGSLNIATNVYKWITHYLTGRSK